MRSTAVLICVILSTVQSQIQFIPKDTDTGLIFTELFKAHVAYDTFKLTYYISLKDFHETQTKVKTCINNIEILCVQIQSLSCQISIKQLTNQLKTMTQELKLMKTLQQRKKRALCEFCGKINHKLTGVMDAETARLYDTKINQLQNETIQQHELIRNQSLLVETIIQTNQLTISNIEKHLNELNDQQNELMNQTSKQFNQTDKRIIIQEMLTITSQMVNEHNRMLNNINKCLNDARRGKIPSFIPHYQMNDDLKRIASTLKSNQKLPIDILQEDPLHIFKFTEVQSTLFADKLWIELSIPIAQREDYQLYKATPVPIKTKFNTIIVKTSYNYFLINTEQQKFIPMSNEQINQGIRTTVNEILYKPSTIIQHQSDRVCVWKLFNNPSLENALEVCETGVIPNTNYLISINENNLYYIFLHKPLQMWENCQNSKPNTFTLEQSGLLRIHAKCSLRTDEFTIQSRNLFSLNMSQIIVPNITGHLISNDQISKLSKLGNFKFDISTESAILIQNREELNKLSERAHKLAESNNYELKWENIHYDQIKSSLLLGFSCISLFSMGGYLVYYILLRKLNPLKMFGKFLGRNDSENPNKIVINLGDLEKSRQTPYPKRKGGSNLTLGKEIEEA